MYNRFAICNVPQIRKRIIKIQKNLEGLLTKHLNIKNANLVCDICGIFTVATKKGLITHKRKCSRTSDVKREPSNEYNYDDDEDDEEDEDSTGELPKGKVVSLST